MIKEITKEQAIKLLAEGKTVYVFDETNRRFGNLFDVLDKRLIADIEEGAAEPEYIKEATMKAEEPKAEEPKAEPVKEEVPVEEQKKKKPRGRQTTIDWGKVGALRKAGWSVSKIADEMRIGQSTVFRHFSEKGDPLKMKAGAM